jgi:DNA-binding IclR family transcriptional regulator
MALHVVAPAGAGEDEPAEMAGLVRSAERAVRIVETLAASPTRLGIAELHIRLGIPSPRLRALIRTLRELQWIEADPGGNAYGVGPRALLAGISYLDKDPVLPYVHDTLAALRAEVGHTVHFGRLDGSHVLYLASNEAGAPGAVASLAGRRLPAHRTATGQALLAELDKDEVDELVGDPSLTAALHDELARVRARSWAFEREQAVPGVACVASVVGHTAPASDAIGCCLPAAEATDDAVTGVVEAVVRHARRLAATLRREVPSPSEVR